MKKLFAKIKLNYIRWLIAQPQYNKARAIEFGEEYGAWFAEEKIALYDSVVTHDYNKVDFCAKKAVRYLHKVIYYSQRASVAQLDKDYD